MNDEIVSSDVASSENIVSEAFVPSESLVSGSEAQSVPEEKIEGFEAQSVGTEIIPIGYSVVVDDRPFMTTPLDDFTVTEGLLLGILLVLLGGLILGVFRRGRK